MRVAAGLLGIVFGLIHGLPAIANINAPAAAQGSGEAGAIPMGARVLWLLASVVTVLGGVLVAFVDLDVGRLVLSAGAIGLFVLAIANGYWMHGTPTLSHHLVRGVLVALIVVLAFLT